MEAIRFFEDRVRNVTVIGIVGVPHIPTELGNLKYPTACTFLCAVLLTQSIRNPDGSLFSTKRRLLQDLYTKTPTVKSLPGHCNIIHPQIYQLRLVYGRWVSWIIISPDGWV